MWGWLQIGLVFGVCISSALTRRCVSMNSLSPGTSTRHVGITVVSADCVKPIEGATLSQFCETFSNGRLNDRSLDVTEVAPGLYMYEAPMISHRVYIRAQGFRSTAITVGPNSISEEVVMKCKGRNYCTAVTHTITMVCDSPEEHLVYPVGALNTNRMTGGITTVEMCDSEIPANVVVDGTVTSSFSITMTQQTVNCDGCTSARVSLVSDCPPYAPVSGVTFSVSATEGPPGVYTLEICQEEVVTISHHDHVQETATVQPGSDQSINMTCLETLVFISHPASKYRNTNDNVKMCCLAEASPGILPITYQWYKDGSPLSGETNDELIINTLQASDGGQYMCAAAIESQGLTAQSDEATLTIDADIFGVQTRQESICGQSYQVSFCMSVPCSYSSTENCVDDGTVSVGSSNEQTIPCGAASVTQEAVLSCVCGPANSYSLLVTVLDASTSARLSGKTVEISGSMPGDTDADGEVTITLPAGSGTVIVSVSDNLGQYLDTTRSVDTSATNSVTVYMFEKAQAVSVDPTVGASLSVSDDPMNTNAPVLLEIPSNSFYDADGNPVTENVNVFLNYVPPDLEINDKAPGVFRAVDQSGDLQPLQTGGVFTVTAEDAMGNRLSSSGLLVTAQHNFKLFVLQPDNTWRLVTTSTSRKRRQTTSTSDFIGEIGIPLTGVRWYNIDKFPENTPCWFKAQIYDISTMQLINDNTTRYTAITIAHTSEPAIFPLYRTKYGTSDLCFEIRCDNPSTSEIPEGYIALEATYFNSVTKRADPYDISQYNAADNADLAALNYTKQAPDPTKPRIKIDLTGQDGGPFFLNETECDNAVNNVLTFQLAPVQQSELDSGNVRCVARVLHESVYNIGIQGSFALSTWGSDNYYISAGEAVPSSDNSSFILCAEYRCSQIDDSTNVTISGNATNRELSYFCPGTTSSPPVVSSTGSGYFVDTNGNVGAALSECKADTSEVYAWTITCHGQADQV